MFKRKLTLGDIFLILANLLPLYGVWFLGWEARQMFLVYCIETVIIGGYNVLKLLITGLYRGSDTWENNGAVSKQPALLFIIFFIVHYGLFVFVQISIFGSVSGYSDGVGIGFLGRIPKLLDDYSLIMLYIFIAIYGVKMMADFIATGLYKRISMGRLMFQPYGRIIVQQFVVIIGSMFLQFGAGKVFMLIFVIIKIFGDIFLSFDHLLEKAEEKQRRIKD